MAATTFKLQQFQPTFQPPGFVGAIELKDIATSNSRPSTASNSGYSPNTSSVRPESSRFPIENKGENKATPSGGGVSDEKFDLSQIRRHKKMEPFIDPTVIVSELEKGVPIESLLIPPNVTENPGDDVPRQIMRIVNKNGLSASLSSVGFTVIRPGSIGIINHNSNIEVAGPGRWKNLNMRSSWVSFHLLTEPCIKVDSLTIARISKGNLGFATHNGRGVVLAEGLHVYNDRNFVFNVCHGNNAAHLKNLTVNIIRVSPGNYARVTENNINKLLLPGNYAIDGNYFTYHDSVSMNSPHIEVFNIGLVMVQKGMLLPVAVDNHPYLLEEGRYTFKTGLFTKEAEVSINTDIIRHKTISRFFVREGRSPRYYTNRDPSLLLLLVFTNMTTQSLF